MVTKSLIKSTSKVAGGCKHINVVSNGFLLINEEIFEPLVKVSFDLYGKNLRRKVMKEVVNEVVNEDDDDSEDEDNLATSDEIFGRVVKVQMKCFFLFPNLKEQQKSGRSPFTVS